ncbi:MAG: UDP-N-acetylmuramoyl-L-alanine--D-glutamate ligase [Polyangiaceae bacterium]
MDLASRRAVVVGLGLSGVAAARLLLARGARVVAADSAPLDRLSDAARALAGAGAAVVAGPHPGDLFAGADLCVVSPGVPAFPALAAFEAGGGEVIGELELASRFVDAPIALVGGTNGKSTTTALVFEMLRRTPGASPFVGGNFGTPLVEAIGAGHSHLVVEISSFQAERVPTLHARAHALLNVTADHLDRYPSLSAYAEAKGRPFLRMEADDVAVVPAGDALCAAEARRGQARLVTFDGGDGAAPADVRVDGGRLADSGSGWSWPLDEVRLTGRHNLANACAAVATARAMGATREAIGAALASFEGLAHRTALVAEVGGVRYYDDSKGTNVGASVAALRGLAEPRAVLIAGGRDKLGAYDPLVDALRERGRGLVLIGEAAERIAAAAAGVLPIARASSMDEAVRAARALATPGDAVLLSPACSSFDMFRDYKDRGDAFVRAVRAIAEERA